MNSIKISTLAFLFLIFTGHLCLALKITFTGTSNGQFIPIKFCRVENVSRNWDTVLIYPDTTLSLYGLGIENPTFTPCKLTVFQNSPNPVTHASAIKFYLPLTGTVQFTVADVSGKQVVSRNHPLDAGYHQLEFRPGNRGTYFLTVSVAGQTSSIKIVAETGLGSGFCSLNYEGKISGLASQKAFHPLTYHPFSPGDTFRFSGYYGELSSVVLQPLYNDGSVIFDFTGALFECGQNLNVYHSTANNVAPVSKITSYGTVTDVPGTPGLCWITSNLGADKRASAVDDTSVAAEGWLWQFNRKQGYYREPSTNKIIPNPIGLYTEWSDWVAASDPCTLELGPQWRLPTYGEWWNVMQTGVWTNWNDMFASPIRLHAPGGYEAGFWTSSGGVGLHGDLRGCMLTISYNQQACGLGDKFKHTTLYVRCLRGL